MRYFILSFLLVAPLISFAQYTPLVGIPGVSGGNFDSYINAMYGLAISIAALLAVIKIIIAGVKWMMTDVVTSKSEAKKDIQGALLGLLVVLAAVLILTVINPQISNSTLSFTNPGLTGPSSTNTNTTTNASQCFTNQQGCTAVSCSITGTCPGFCTPPNGVIQLGFFRNTCLVPTGTVVPISCQYDDSTGQYDCASAIGWCVTGNYTPASAGTTGVASIQ